MKKYITEMVSKMPLTEGETLPKDILDGEANVEEVSTSAGAGPYSTPFSFGKAKDSTVNAVGYTKVKKKDMTKDIKKESQFVQMSRAMHINEISYKDYKSDSTTTSSKKVNQSIHEVNKKMYEIEQIVKRNLKLKQETKVNNSEFWKSTQGKMYKISERLIRIAQQLKELNA